MKYVSGIILFSFVCLSSNGQIIRQDSTLIYKTIFDQADKMGSALSKKDYVEFIKYIDPEMIIANGGEKKMIENIKESELELKSYGDSIMNVRFTNLSKIIKINNEYQCTLSQILTMKVPNGKLITKSSIIGFSKDYGKRWFFIDCADRNISDLIILMPYLSKDLIIDKESKPIFFKDN